MHGDGDGSQEATLHVQVKSWSGARRGSNGCHYLHCAARATVLAVCCISVPAVPAIIMAATSLPQRPNIHLHTSLHQQQPIIHIEPSSTTTWLHHIISRPKTSICLPPFCYLLGTGCLSGAGSAPPPSEEGLDGSAQ